jgi:TolA-binding protein
MKAEERHRLKENAFATNTARVLGNVTANRDRWTMGAIGLLVILLGLGGFGWWNKHQREKGGAELGEAMAIEQASIAPAPTVPGASQTPGTFPTETARSEAALKAFEKIAAEFGSSTVGVTARYHTGVTLMSLGRYAEAQAAFEKTTADAGSSVYGPMGRMGRAQAQLMAGKFDDAIKGFTDLSGERDGALPVDGVLMQLARTYQKAGRTQEARATFKRVTDEFPDSPFAQDARQQLALLGT